LIIVCPGKAVKAFFSMAASLKIESPAKVKRKDKPRREYKRVF
jgi:hypothetical protein